MAPLALDLFGLRQRHVQADGQIVGEVHAADGHRAGVRDRAFKEDHQVSGMRADVEQAHAQFALVGGKRGLGGGDGLEHGLRDFEPGAIGAGDGALKCAARTGGDVQVDFEARADHAHRIEDAGLIVDDELAREQVENFAIRRALDGAGALHGGAHVFARNLAHAAAQVEAAVGIEPEDVRAADADDALVDVGAGHALGVLAGGFHGLRGGTELGDDIPSASSAPARS